MLHYKTLSDITTSLLLLIMIVQTQILLSVTVTIISIYFMCTNKYFIDLTRLHLLSLSSLFNVWFTHTIWNYNNKVNKP